MQKEHGMTGKKNASKVNPRCENINIRATRSDKSEWEHKAFLLGISLSEWITRKCKGEA
ncbi:MAG: hypothetical protein WC449_05685 [Candidatus Paceibacterota bacterium]